MMRCWPCKYRLAVMEVESNPGNPAPGVERAASAAPMHYMIEIQLMTNQIVGDSSEENRIKYDRQVKRQHVRRYLLSYYKEHAALPTGRRYLGMTRPLNLEIGMVDLDAIRREIRADFEKRNGMNFESLAVIENLPDYPMNSEDATGLKKLAAGRDRNQTIFDLRHELSRRGKKSNRL